MNYYKYDKKYMYDKINKNILYVTQDDDVRVSIVVYNERMSRILLSIYELEEELNNNNLVIGEPDTMRLLYGKIQKSV